MRDVLIDFCAWLLREADADRWDSWYETVDAFLAEYEGANDLDR